MGYVLGIDLGTSSLKGLLADENGNVIATASSSYPLINLQPGYSEQSPDLWVKACDNVIFQLKEKVADFTENLAGISFSGQMHSLVVLDEKGIPLRNAILWNDVRTTKQCQEIMTDFKEEIIEITKNIALEGFTLPKVLWLQEYEPDIWEKVRHILLPKDYLGYWLTGNMHMDYSDAAGTLMLDLENKEWSDIILEKYHIPTDYMPKLIKSSGFIGSLKKELQILYGFKQDVKIFAGGADNACAAVGAGIIEPGNAMVSIGTSGVFLSYEESSKVDYSGKIHLFHHAIEDSYYSMGVTLAAGHSLEWFRSTFANNQEFEQLLKDIGTVNPGSEGLLFTPYIVGERTPYADSKIRGTFTGIDTTHRLKHFTRSVIEGITFSLKDSQVIMENVSGRSFKRVVSVGGGSKNKEWLKIQANVFNAEIVCLEAEQGPGLGAAMIAAMGLKWFSSMEICKKTFVKYTDVIYPDPKLVALYDKYYSIYREVYAATKNINHKLKSFS